MNHGALLGRPARLAPVAAGVLATLATASLTTSHLPLAAGVALGALALGIIAVARHLPASLLFVTTGAVTAGLVDAPRRIHVGGSTALAYMTFLYAVVGVLLVVPALGTLPTSAARLLLPSGLFVVYALITAVWSRPTLAGLQNILVFTAFFTAVAVSAALACRRTAAENTRFVSRLFSVLLATAALLYAGSPFLGAFGVPPLVSGRIFALVALIGIAWGAASFRYGNRCAGLLSVLLWLLILVSLSRMAFAASTVVFALAFVSIRSPSAVARLLLTSLVLFAAVYTTTEHFQPFRERNVSGDVVSVGGQFSLNVSGRAGLWHTTWASFRSHPAFGQGAGSAERLITRTFGTEIGHPHNEYLRLLHDYGIVGAALWFLGLGSLGISFWRRWAASSITALGGASLQLAALLSIVAMALAMITDNVIVYLFVMFPFGILVGAALGTRDDDASAAPQVAAR